VFLHDSLNGVEDQHRSTGVRTMGDVSRFLRASRSLLIWG